MTFEKKYIRLLCLGLCTVLLLSGTMAAAGEMVQRYVISGGGGNVAAGDVVLRGVIAEPLAGAVSNGSVNLCSGFTCGPGSTSGLNTPAPQQDEEVYLPLLRK